MIDNIYYIVLSCCISFDATAVWNLLRYLLGFWDADGEGDSERYAIANYNSKIYSITIMISRLHMFALICHSLGSIRLFWLIKL